MADENDTAPFVDLSQFPGQIFRDLEAELEARFPELRGLSERDQFAVCSAIIKAAWRGTLRGAVEYSAEVRRQAQEGRLRVESSVRLDGDEPDPWADRYGGESQ